MILDIPSEVKKRRKMEKITIHNLSEISGVSTATISRFEAGENVTIGAVQMIMKALDLTFIIIPVKQEKILRKNYDRRI